MTPQEEFLKMLYRSGLIAWHDAGYDGRKIKVLNCESMDARHGEGTGTVLQRCAPGAEFYGGDLFINTIGEILIGVTLTVDDVSYDFAEYVKLKGIDIITCSREGSPQKGLTEYFERLQKETGVIIFNSAGNKYAGSMETLSHMLPSSVALLVGAVNLDMNRLNYSSVGEELDFMAYSGLIGGTSASAPFLAGMTACIFSKYGKMLPGKTKEYLKSISKDLGIPGDDNYYGEGMPILGSIDKIIKMKIGSNVMTIDGMESILDQPPEINKYTGRTLIPVRALGEAVGGKVDWDSTTKEITITI